jgi:hypothetical protein
MLFLIARWYGDAAADPSNHPVVGMIGDFVQRSGPGNDAFAPVSNVARAGFRGIPVI